MFYDDQFYFHKISFDKCRVLVNKYLDKLIEIAPNSEDALFCKVVFSNLEFEKKKETIEVLLSKDNLTVHHLSALGAIMGRMGYLTQGLSTCKKAIELDPLYIFNFYNLAEIYFLQEKFNLSINIIQRMLIAYPEVEKEFYVDISHCYSLQKEFDKAIEGNQHFYRSL